MPQRLTKAERQDRIEKMRASNPRISQVEMAEQLGVDPKTVQRDIAEMKAQKRVLKSEIPRNDYMRDEVFERIMSTQDMIDATIKSANTMAELLEEQIRSARAAGAEKCDACGRKGWPVNALDWQSYFKGLDTVKANLELRAKVLGEFTDSPQLTINQIDADVSLIIKQLNDLVDAGKQITLELRRDYPELRDYLGDKYEEFMGRIEAAGPRLARQLYAEIIGVSQRRARRTPEFVQLVSGDSDGVLEGEFSELMMLGGGDE